MRLAELEDFQKGDEEGNDLLFARCVGKQLVKPCFAHDQPAFDGLHAAFHGIVVAPDIAQAEIHLARLGRSAVLHAQKGFPQRFER